MALARRLGILSQRSQPSIHSAFSSSLHHASRFMSSTSIYIGRMPEDTKEEHLRYIFQRFGTITQINMEIMKKKSGKTKSFAFMEFATKEEAKAAIAGMNGIYFRGRKLRVELPKKEESKDQEDDSS